MSGFSAIDLTKLNAPNVIEELSFENILSKLINDLKQRDESFTAVLQSEPVVKLLEVVAYREVLLRSRINDASKAVMLAYATESDLDNLAAYFAVERQLVDPGDEDAIPPVPPTFESDDRLRKRTQLSLEGHSTAGPIGSYIFHALAVSPKVKDVDVASPEPGKVVLTVLSTEGDGTPSNELIELVAERVNAKEVRPLTDHVSVKKASILPYRVEAELILYEGPDSEVVRQTALEKANTYVEQHHLLGNDITLSGLYAALHQEGVQRVNLKQPTTDIVVVPDKAARCSQIQIYIGGRDE